MKKLLLLLIIGILSVTSLSADEVFYKNDKERLSGNWYSTTSKNMDGVSNIQVKSTSSTNKYYTAKIVDKTGGDTEFSQGATLSKNSYIKSGSVFTTFNHYMQGQVFTSSTSYAAGFGV